MKIFTKPNWNLCLEGRLTILRDRCDYESRVLREDEQEDLYVTQ